MVWTISEDAKKIEIFPFKVVQMKFLAMHITLNFYTVGALRNLHNLRSEHIGRSALHGQSID